jgi:DNA-binding MarR family transcriptional regulator
LPVGSPAIGRPGPELAEQGAMTFQLVAALVEHGNPRQSGIAAVVEFDLSTASRQLREPERLGLVTRRRDGEDGRAYRDSLTERGLSNLAAISFSRSAMPEDVFSDWAEGRAAQQLPDRLMPALAAQPGAPSSARRILALPKQSIGP